MSNSSIIISEHVVNSVKSLPETDRKAIASALAEELLLGQCPDDKLTPFQAMLYSIIHYYVRRDTERASAARVAAI